MTRFSFSLRVLAAPAALVVALQLPAGADDEKAPPREHPDITFARGLADRGWYDLAGEVLDEILKKPVEATVKEKAGFLRADFAISESELIADPKERAEKVAKARAFFEDYAKRNASTQLGTEARLRVGEIFLQEGDAALARIRTSEDSEVRKTARVEAEDRYKKAEKYFEELREEYRKQYEEAPAPPVGDDGAPPPPPEEYYRLVQVEFLCAKVLFQKAQLHEKGSKEKLEELGKAAEAFKNINFEYGDTFEGYEAAIYLGLCYREMNRLQEACSAFDSAAGLYTAAGGEPGVPLDGRPADIVSRAVFLKTQTLNDARLFKAAIDEAKRFQEYFPELVRANDRLALSLKIEEGKAWIGLGEGKKGIAILEKVIDLDPNGPIGAAAKEAMGQSTVAVSPERGLAAAEALIDKGRVAEGLARLRLLIADIEGAGEEAKKSLPHVWYRLGQAYYGLKRFDEAAACYEVVARRFKSSPEAPKSLFYAANCYNTANGAFANEYDKKRYLDALRILSTSFPTDSAAKASSFLLGNERLDARDFVGAAKEYEKVDSSAGEFYDVSQYQAGVAWLLESRAQNQKKQEAAAKDALGKSRAAFERAVAWADGGAEKAGVKLDEGDRGATLKKLGFQAWLRIAEIRLHPLAKDPKAALEAAKSAEKAAAAGGEASPERLAEARLLAVQAHLALGQLTEAEESLTLLVQASAESPRAVQGEREVAIALDAAVLDARKTKADPAKIQDLLGRAGDHYERWITTAEKAGVIIPITDAARVADRLFLIAVDMNGLPENTLSFTEVGDLSALKARDRFGPPAVAYQAAVAAIDEKAKAAPPKPVGSGAAPPAAEKGAEKGLETWLLLVKLGEAYGFAGRYDDCRKAFVRAIESEKFITGKGDEARIDVAVAKAKPALISAYADLARAAIEVGAKDPKAYDQAKEVLARVINAAAGGSDLWWRAKHDFFLTLYLKGEYQVAETGLRAMKRTNPDFDGGKFGYKAKLEALLEKVEKKRPGGGK